MKNIKESIKNPIKAKRKFKHKIFDNIKKLVKTDTKGVWRYLIIDKL